MTARRVAVGLLVLIALVGGVLWARVYRMRAELERYEARRLGNPGLLSDAGAPGAAGTDATGSESADASAVASAPPALPATLAAPTLGGQVLRLSDESPLDGAVVE